MIVIVTEVEDIDGDTVSISVRRNAGGTIDPVIELETPGSTRWFSADGARTLVRVLEAAIRHVEERR